MTDKDVMKNIFIKNNIGFIESKNTISMTGGMKNVSVLDGLDRALIYYFDESTGMLDNIRLVD